MSKTHWKKMFNPNYIGAYSLEDGKDLIVKIKSVGMENVVGSDGRKEECLVAQLVGQKPFILNVTNSKTIAKIAGSDYIEDWGGISIQIYAKKVNAFGAEVMALRVRDFKPKAAEKLTPERFTKMLEAIKSGKYSADKALESFDLTNSQRGQIEAIKKQTA